MDEIKAKIKQFILDEFLPGEDAAELTDTTPLISGGIVDSIGITRLVVFLDEQFGIEVKPHEATGDYMNTIQTIAELVQSKLAETGSR